MKAWIFDIDGVVTNPEEKQAKPEIVSKLLQILQNGDVLALNTGRSLSWVQERLLQKLLQNISYDLLQRFFVVGEKGNSILFYSNGKWEEKDTTDSLPPEEFRRKIQELVNQKYHDSMFIDATKKTMVTVEMKDGYSNAEFSEKQKKFVKEVQEILEAQYEGLSLRVDPSQIATDIQDKTAGKQLGASEIANWMKQESFEIQEVFTFGDSPSDIEMAENLAQSYAVTFVFINEREMLKIHPDLFKIIYTKEKFDKGTLEFLNAHL